MNFTPPPGRTKWPPVQQWTEAEWSCWLKQHSYTDAAIAQYLDHDRFVYGIGLTAKGERAGPHNAYAPGVTWLYQPTPKGVTLHATRHAGIMNTLWGGAAGGTKSQSARAEAVSECLFTTRDDYRVIVVRRELEELRRTHLDKIEREARKICAVLGDDKAIKVTTQPPLATFTRTGAKIVYAHAQNPGDEEKYLSEDYDLAHVDESTQLLWSQIVGIQGRVRNDTKINRIGRLILTTNPGGLSHDESVAHFITKDVNLDENPKYDPADYTFIVARLYDNPYYMDADGTYTTYEKRLFMYRRDRRMQLLAGDWGTLVGQFFTDFDKRVHVHTWN